MAIPLCRTGFEEPDTATLVARGWTITSTPLITTAQRARTAGGFGGNQSIQLVSGETLTTPVFNAGAPTTSRHFFHRVYFATAGTVSVFQTFRLAGSDQYTIELNPITGLIVHRRGGPTATVVQTSPYAFTNGRWYLIEIELDAANAGSCSVYIERSATASSTFAGDTQALGSAGWDQIRCSVNTGSAELYLDDFLVFSSAAGRASADWYCLPLVRPTGNGTTIQLTSSSGNPNWQNVDETTPSTADYNSATLVLLRDRYTYGALSPTGGPSFLGISTLMYASVDNTGLITQARGTIAQGVSTAFGTYVTIAGVFQYVLLDDFFDTDPGTAAAWTEAGVNSAQAGIEFN